MRGLGSTDHKVLARRYLWTGLFMLTFGGLLAMVLRWQLAYPGRPLPGGAALTPHGYTGVFTLHGLTMVFFAISPLLLGAIGTFVTPLLIGAREMAFPKLTRLSYWIYVAAIALLFSSLFARFGTGTAGWTSYPPLSTGLGTPGWGQTAVSLAVLVVALSSLLGAVNLVVTVVRSRAPGMHWMRLPLTVWSLFFASILLVLFTPSLFAATGMVLSDRIFGTRFFLAGAQAVAGGGDPAVYLHLFWLFGHPEVYVLILPAWGLIGDLVAWFSRRPAHWYRATVYAMAAVVALSGLVYAHHLFTAGLSPMLGRAFMALTLIISIPAEILFLNWLLTLWRGSIHLSSPMLAALGGMVVFGLGGITGLPLGAVATDVVLHDTLWVVGHFHLTMAGATFLALCAALYYWFPKMFGCALNERLGQVHVVLSSALFLLVFIGLLVAGYAGQHRRLFDPYQYAFIEHLLPLNKAVSHAAFLLALVQGLLVFNVAQALLRRQPVEANPWRVGTLEWTHGSSALPLVLRGAHELSQPEVERALGRDWIGQAEALPESPDETEALAS